MFYKNKYQFISAVKNALNINSLSYKDKKAFVGLFDLAKEFDGKFTIENKEVLSYFYFELVQYNSFEDKVAFLRDFLDDVFEDFRAITSGEPDEDLLLILKKVNEYKGNLYNKKITVTIEDLSPDDNNKLTYDMFD